MKRLNFALCLVCTLLISSGARAATLRTVALSGQNAPGTTSGVNYAGFGFSGPALNESDRTAFYATLAGSGVDTTNEQGIWSEGSGSLALVARTGSQAPGAAAGVNFGGLGSPLLNDAGQTAFYGFGASQGVWSEGSGSLALVARSGDPAAGISGPIFRYNYGVFDALVLNNLGQTAFSASITSPTGPISPGLDDKANWAERSGAVAIIARGGNQAPGAPAGVRFAYTRGFLGFGEEFKPVLNNNGQMAFMTRLSGTGVTTANNRGIWSEGSGSMGPVARSGSQAPGTDTGVNFSGFGFAQPALNDAGDTAFYAALTGTGVDTTNNAGIWSEGSGSLALVARTGSQAPGSDTGVNFSGLGAPTLNDAGKTAFQANITGIGVVAMTNDAGIWSEGLGSLVLVIRTGDPAPGTPGGVNFSGFGFAQPALNNAGQTAFSASLSGSDVDSTNDQGIWATDSIGALQLIARTGDPLEVAPGDVRTISGLAFTGSSGNSDGHASGFNNRGQLAFMANFTDGSAGIFVSNRVAVPEPNTLLLLCLGSVVVLWRRRAVS